jgi:hypothetical protein
MGRADVILILMGLILETAGNLYGLSAATLHFIQIAYID